MLMMLRITSYNVCYTKLLRISVLEIKDFGLINNISVFPNPTTQFVTISIQEFEGLEYQFVITSYSIHYTKLYDLKVSIQGCISDACVFTISPVNRTKSDCCSLIKSIAYCIFSASSKLPL